MKILIDLDGIVADTLPYWLDRVAATTGIRATPEQITDWNLSKNYPLDILKPSAIFSILNEKGFTLGIPAMQGAFDTIKLLKQDGHEVSLLTARYGDNCMPETIQWLNREMPWFNAEENAWFCYHKNRILGDILIDDKAETLIKYRAEHPKSKLITIDYPYNQHAEVDFRTKKDENSWTNIHNYIKSLES